MNKTNMERSPRLPQDRNSLYELVWSAPLTEIAARYKTREDTIISYCIDLQIPRPMEGYWKAKEKGNAPVPPPLRPINTARNRVSTIPVQDSPSSKIPDEKGNPSHSNRRVRKSVVKVVNGGSLLNDVKTIFHSAPITDIGYFRPTKRKLLDLNVSDHGLESALTFLEKFFQAVEKEGYPVMLADTNERLLRREIDTCEGAVGRTWLFPSLWKPITPSVICIHGIWIGFSLVEMTENIPAKRNKNRYIPDEKMVRWTKGKHGASLINCLTKDLPCGRFKFQLYSPYHEKGWLQKFMQTKTCGLVSQIRKMLEALESGVETIIQEIKQEQEREDAWRKECEIRQAEYVRQEAIRKREEARKFSIAELNNVMPKWCEDKRIEQFFTEAEADIMACDPAIRSALLEKLKAAKAFIAGKSALERLLEWQTPEER